MIDTTQALRPWRDRLIALRSERPDLARFVTNALRSADEQDLLLYPPPTLETLLETAFSHIGQRTPGKAEIRIWTPDPEMISGVTIIDIYSADTPFIVDSALAAIRAAGGSIRFMTHPAVVVDDTVTPWRVIEETEGARKESVLQVHIDTPSDPHALSVISEELTQTMAQVRAAVVDWRDMLERLRNAVVAYRAHPPAMREQALTEAIHFLAWLADHNFTFLGMREYRLTGEGEDRTLVPLEGSGLGILRDPDYLYLRQGTRYVHMNGQHLAFLATDEPLMVTKANRRSLVHRRVHMDYVGIKTFDPDGTITGELRILGLFTSASLATPVHEVPLIRRKIAEVMRQSGFDPRSHAGKALMNTLDNYPRDELFQISQNELFEFANVIATLPDRPRVRVLPRIDRFDNFVSVLVYLPRDRFDSNVRARIGEYLATRYEGRVSAFAPDFPEGDLARVHFIIGRNGGPTPRPDREALEAEISELTRTFADRLLSAAPRPGDIADYASAFSADYQVAHSHADALDDIAVFKALGPDNPLAVRLSRGTEGPASLTLNVYHRADPIPLSARVPMLENFGFSVIDERTYTIHPLGPQPRFLHAMSIRTSDGTEIDLGESARRIEDGILAVSSGLVENDGYNRLTLTAGLGHTDVAILRALGRYLKQVGIAWSQTYIWTALSVHPATASALVELFHTLHDPHIDADREAAAQTLRAEIAAGLETITSIDEDRIIRRLLNLIEASVRTNLYQRVDGKPRPALAIKFDATRLEGIPQPRPWREIFVYSPRVEGIHMRGGPIARGGLRWSDRAEDFRTEILGLVKAQMVKNAVIVPVGAKGGFVPRLMPASPDRDTFLAEGTACYKIFVSSLLDVTDNLIGDTVLPPEEIFRRDGDDPYLVVAADKGTASFSDTANAISESRDFWLGDAFASGGSAGYDHKKMGITARGGWEAVKRHFREIDIDIQTQPFTVAGVGDMSGDVFGNGMLLSPKIRLVAAFDHRDIFIDPDPDIEKSLAERERLFALPRSSWQDYDAALISQGGGVFSRQAKSIPLSPQMQTLLDLTGVSASPSEIMSAILRADIDLLWFGGIGTYIRATDETDASVGDKANDAIRVPAQAVRAKVIGEGANLGLTQRGRIEYALNGGRINTDAIDNSAGVNSSDLEVNIKIALSDMVRSGSLAIEDRNSFLVEMTDEVAELCLRNNYLQTLALSLAQRRGMTDFPDMVDFMDELEAAGELDRAVEYLPDDAMLAERAASGAALTRPELAVLLAYAKLTLYGDLLKSPVPDDPYLARELFRYFPETLKSRYPQTIENHRLRREVIATVLSNAMINRGGPAFVTRLTSITAAEPGAVAFAYAAARDSFDLAGLNAAIDDLDTRVSGDTQLALYAEVQGLQVSMALWFLRNEDFSGGLSDMIERYRAGISTIRAALSDLVSPFLAEAVASQEQGFEAGGTPPDLARSIAALSVLSLAPDAVLVAHKCNAEVRDAARAMFAVIEMFRLGRLTEQGAAIDAADRFDRMAIDRALANLTRGLRDLTTDILSSGDGPVEDRIAAWKTPRATTISRMGETVADLIAGDLTISRLSVAAGLLSDLARS
ncbi:NAD-glutamate dehydrogenase [Pelagibacterium halotolerans]|uniref:NAD-specific glutamate dehydrogenase, large form n=1 Tax=Pelagibacterium halotolerans (strain DSM 22347 / JCM 15775 / CGMCC 1.7692 / B2) TaxID=1082931 RepID=G4R6W5_PELHB|nr:NAD-glutamate dehydrogenase [Pelagibacterium halotolerans]AEQ53238.1 NAD-specific glutamate dehydrogenase, large form [Pelagibacterium halotolerans B2]SEA96402.1 glutamate dehydrogenase (NAD) [Pelagibacterium halotolerans]